MKKKTSLLIIVILAGLLRFVKLGTNPPSLNLDEVAIGYNAYSILKTGRDEYGERFPLAFRSHDDYKPPLYIYLTVPSIAIFGLNGFAVRFPSALLGTLSILSTYLLVSELFKNEKQEIKLMKFRLSPALLTAFLLTISPWHLQYSRAAFEVNAAVFFITTGTWAFLKGLSNSKYWLLTSIMFALSLYVYQANRLFLPLFSFLLFLIFRKSILSKLKRVLLPSVLILLLLAPLVPLMASKAGLMRFKGTSIFENPGLIEEDAKRALLDTQKGEELLGRIFHNRRRAAALMVLEGYLKHFRPDFLFLGRIGPPVHYTPNVGLLYLIELPFLFLGLISLAEMKDKRFAWLILSWLLLAPLASALTWDVPSATRMTIALPTFHILVALGLISFTYFKNKQSLSKVINCALIAIYATSFLNYLHQYWVHAPIEYAQSWQYGYKEAVEYAFKHLNEYDRIIVSTKLKQAQNFFAFYTKYDPATYIFVDGGTVSGGFLETRNKFGRFEFHPIDYSDLNSNQRLLLIDQFDNMPAKFKDKALTIIDFPNGEPAISISKT